MNMRNYIQRFKSFFRGLVTGGRQQVVVKGGADLVIDNLARLMLEGAAGDSYIAHNNTFFTFVVSGGERASLTPSTMNLNVELRPQADNARAIGDGVARWTNIFAVTEVGIHDGTNFTDSLTDAGLTLAEQVGVVDADGESVIIGDVDHALQLPVMTTAQRNALAQQDGMVVYNSEDDEAQMSVNGTWVKLDTAAAGS